MNDPGGKLPDFSSSVPVSGTELFFILKAGMASKRIRIRLLRDVAWGPRVETGAGVPGYSGGLAAAWWFRHWIFCSWGR